jgi:hypothetical protein
MGFRDGSNPMAKLTKIFLVVIIVVIIVVVLLLLLSSGGTNVKLPGT